MDDVKPREERYRTVRAHNRSNSSSFGRSSGRSKKQRHPGQTYWLVRSLGKAASTGKRKLWNRFRGSAFAKWPDQNIWQRLYALVTLVLFIVSTVAVVVQPLINATSYKLAPATRSLLPQPNAHLAEALKYKPAEMTFAYNEGYSPSALASSDLRGDRNGDPRFSATFAQDPHKGVTITDPVNQIDFSIKPKFQMASGKKDQNQMVYPLSKADGYLVYTAQIASVKEDIVLQTPGKDTMTFDYELAMGNGLAAKLEKDGSVGIYGSDLPLNGNVTTGSEQDAELLKKAQQNAPKTKFLFGIPAPIVKESGQKKSSVNVHFELNGNTLGVVAERLKDATYPLTIDPSVYIETAAQLMKGNNESNVAFDIATEQFKKGSTTGARIDEWTETGVMNDATYDQGVAAAGGYIYRAGGRSGRIIPWIASQKETALSTVSGSFVMDMPDVRPAGDLYVAIIAHDVQGTGVITPPAGWTEYADLGEHGAYYKIGTNVSGGNEAATYTWTKSGTTAQWAGVILRIKNYDVTSVVSATGSSGSAATPVFPAVTPNAQGALVLRGAGFNDDAPNEHGYSPTSHDDVASGYSGGTTGVGFVVTRLDSPPASGVSTGTATMPTSAGISDTYGSSTIAINGVAATPAYNQTLQWAHFNSSGTIDSPAPGSDNVACSNWCTDSAYNLPSGGTSSTGAGNVGMSLIAYNGYLYAIGGYDGTNLKSTVYIAKLGAKGEPSLWHPTDPNQANWVYWYKDTGLNGGTARAYQGAYAYNGKMYVLGGDTNTTANSGASSTVEIADILPNGTLGTWASGQALTGGARYGASVQAYNGTLYIMGGNNNGTMLNLTQLSRLNSDGTMNAWQTAAVDGSNTFNTARSSQGGVMSGIWGGYIYLAGGCSAVNASGLCTTIASDVQLASINADGSLDSWNTMANLRNTRFGSSFIAWQDNLYRFGGCSKQDASTGDCYAAHPDIQYGVINQDGDASTVSITTATGSGACVDPDPYDCNLPPGGTGSGQGGQALSASLILNGYLYVIGGCTTNACTTMSGNTAYSAIDSSGKLKSPPSCSGGTYGAWCIDSTNQVSGGIGAAGVSVFGGNIYLVGGQDGGGATGNIYRNSVNSDGSLSGAWQSQTMTGVGATSVSYTYAYARANPGSAGTNPGNLYIFGGCTSPAGGAGCTSDSYTQNVYKCNITSTGTIAGCSTTGQLQIGTVTGGTGAGLGIHAGAVYANYIYLIGGVAPGILDLKTVRYAKFDNSNNVVAVSGSAWIESANQTSVGRRRGSAFGYNGYLYVVGGFDATIGGTLNDIQFAKVTVSDGSIGAFQTSGVTINQRWGLGLAVSNSYAYVIGGCKDGTSPTCNAGGLDNTVQTFQVYNNDSGAPGGYSVSSNLYATDRIGASAAVYNGYLYVAGGCTSATDCTAATTNVQRAAIDANGSVGSWSNTTAALGGARAYGELEIAGGTLYYLGGQTGADTTGQSTIYYGTPTGTGDITSWTSATKGIGDTGSGAQARTQFSATVWNNRIYVTGGFNTTPTAQTNVYVSPQLNSGGDITSNWTSSTAFNVARSGHVTVAYANNLYILGGYDGTNYLSDVQFAQIASNGTVGSWTYTTSLPMPIRQADGFASNGYMYLFGGRSSTNDCTARTLIAPISANTTIASGNNPTGIGEWYETNRRFDGGRYGAAAVSYQGKAYVLGGGCQGIVMQDDFDATYDATQWSNTTGMTAGTACQSTSTSNTFYLTTGGTTNQAATKDVNVSSGGTVYFKLYIPLADTGTCFRGETNASLFGSNPDNVQLEYSTNGGGGWTQIGGDYAYNGQDPLKSYAVTIPAGARTASTRFRWIMPTGAANDSFALEDVSIIATGSGTISYATSSRVTQTALLSQPQVAIYSRLIDAGKDVTPTVFLMNGLDNSIGARWQFSYRSMNDPANVSNACGGSVMTGFGQLTNFGDVTLGVPGAYTAKNSSGTNIGCSRFFFMTISIDASKTYGYPDDITRGPTLDNLIFYFNSNPGQRLLHGKTFLEGIQQPLDTPCRQSNQPTCPLP